MPWQRPASVPVGQVWLRFQGRERDGKPARMYQVRDMDPNTGKQCLDMMEETFLRDEPLCDILGITKDPPSIATIRANWEQNLTQEVCLACYTEVDGRAEDLVGFNIIVVKSQDDKEDDGEVIGEPWKKLLLTLTKAEDMCNVFQHYDIDTYLSSSGLTVLPEHRGQNIGAKIFAAREPLCKALGIRATATVFTALQSQVLAKKCNFEELAALNYSAMLQYGVDLSNCPTPSAKLMGIKYY